MNKKAEDQNWQIIVLIGIVITILIGCYFVYRVVHGAPGALCNITIFKWGC